MAENFGKTALSIANHSIDNLKSWINEVAAAVDLCPNSTKSATNSPVTSYFKTFGGGRQGKESSKIRKSDSDMSACWFSPRTSRLSRTFRNNPEPKANGEQRHAVSTVGLSPSFMIRDRELRQVRRSRTCGDLQNRKLQVRDVSARNLKSAGMSPHTSLAKCVKLSTNSKASENQNEGTKEEKNTDCWEDEFHRNIIMQRDYNQASDNRRQNYICRQNSYIVDHRNFIKFKSDRASMKEPGYERQDSGFVGECEDTFHDFDEKNLLDIHLAEEINSCSCDFDPLSWLIDFGEKDKYRDPYRTVRRPFVKSVITETENTNKQAAKHLSHPLAPASINQQISTDVNIPKLKISIQRFAQSNQMRVILSDLHHVNQLCRNDSIIRAKICLMPGKRQRKKTKTITTSSLCSFKDVIYFRGSNLDEMPGQQLRICIFEKHRWYSRDKKIGEAWIPLDGYSFVFETVIWCKILDSKVHDLISDTPLFEIISN